MFELLAGWNARRDISLLRVGNVGERKNSYYANMDFWGV
jgi:hypothetical protein